MKNGNKEKAEEMRAHIEACSESGLTVRDYCIQNGIVKSSYYYWHKRLSAGKSLGGFTPISVSRGSSVEITYPNGVQLSFTGEVNAVTIKALVCCI